MDISQIFLRAFKVILIGLPLGGLCVGAAILVAGMGHGWDTPMRFGLLSLLLFPLAIFRLRTSPIGWRNDAAVTLLIVLIFLIAAVITGPLLGTGVPLGAIHMQGWLLIFSIVAIYVGLHALLDRYRLSMVWGDMVLLGVAMICNFAIYRDATGDAAFGFRGNIFEILWLTVWAVWQVIAFMAFVRHLRERRVVASPA